MTLNDIRMVALYKMAEFDPYAAPTNGAPVPAPAAMPQQRRPRPVQKYVGYGINPRMVGAKPTTPAQIGSAIYGPQGRRFQVAPTDFEKKTTPVKGQPGIYSTPSGLRRVL